VGETRRTHETWGAVIPLIGGSRVGPMTRDLGGGISS